MSLKIGITEAGDPSFDYSWVEKMQEMNMAILITKNITDKFIESVLPHKDKIIVHATCTGYGGTVIEKNVPEYSVQLAHVRKLIASGFPKEQIVVRIDPIIPTKKGVQHIVRIVSEIYTDIKRFRISVMDNYPHVQERFKNHNLPVLYNGNFQASEEEFALVDSVLKQLKMQYGVVFESCAELYLKEAERIGCVSQKDLDLFGLKNDTENLKGQRKTCLCVAGKTELLTHKRYGKCRKFGIDDSLGGSCGIGNNCKECEQHEIFGCPNACLYCYWKK